MYQLVYCNTLNAPIIAFDSYETRPVSFTSQGFQEATLNEYLRAIDLEYLGLYHLSLKHLLFLYETLQAYKTEFPLIYTKILLELAKVNLQLGKFKDAQEKINEGAEIIRKDHEKTEELDIFKGEISLVNGSIYLEKKEFELAISSFKEAMKVFERTGIGQYLNLSQCYRRMGEVCSQFNPFCAKKFV